MLHYHVERLKKISTLCKMNIIEEYKKYGYPSAQKLYLLLHKKVKLETIKSELASQPVKQLYYSKPKTAGGHILALNPMDSMQIDLCFMDKFGRQNHGYNYILLAIDVFSRYAWGVPLKTKNINEVVAAFSHIPVPHCIISDNGSEFVGKPFQNMLEHLGTVHQTAILGDHHALGIIDRFTLTLKNCIYKSFIANDNVEWKDKLDDILKTYNNTPHAGIYNYTPEQALNNEKVGVVLTTINHGLMGIKKHLQVEEGDEVRLRVPENKFKRGYLQKWESDIAKVDSVAGNTVMIDGKPHKIVDVQVVPKGTSNVGKGLKVATKEHKVKRILAAEGVDVSNVREKRVREVKFDKSLVGRLIDRGNGETGKITRYDEEGPYHFYVTYDKKAKLKNELMNKEEVSQFLVR